MRNLLVATRYVVTVLLMLLLFTALAIAVVPCYLPDGFSETSLEYQPCDYSNSYGTRMCCATNRPGNPSGGNESLGNTADTCIQNGLCMNQGVHATGINWTVFWRESCTRNDWSAGGCLNACANDTVCRR